MDFSLSRLWGGSGSAAPVALLSNSEFNTFALGQGNPRFVTLTNDKHIRHTGGELAIKHILDMNDLKTTDMAFTVSDNTNTAHVATPSDSGDVADFKLDKLGNLPGFEVELDGVVNPDQGVRITQSATIVGHHKRDALGTELDLLDLEKLVLGLLGGNAMDGEAALDVVHQAEVLGSFLNSNDVHESSGEGGISPDLAVDFDETLHQNLQHFLASQSILQAVPQEDNKGQALALLVRTGRGFGSLCCATSCKGDSSQ